MNVSNLEVSLIHPSATPAKLGSVLLEAILSAAAFAHSHPIWSWLVAELRYRRGAFAAALQSYRQVEFLIDRIKQDQRFIKYQQLQFMIERCKALLGEPTQEDPLLLCHAKPADEQDAIAGCGSFSATIHFYGFLIKGYLNRKCSSSKDSEVIIISIDGVVVRRRNVRFIWGRGRFSFRLKRPVLSHLPMKSRMTIRTAAGKPLACGRSTALLLEIPSGKDDIGKLIAGHGLLTKKGSIPLAGQDPKTAGDASLLLYMLAAEAFESIIGRPLFLMFGTLLGYHRDGALIPGDDDFDVGYVSRESGSARVKAETMEIMGKLLDAGFDILLNWQGRPMRLLHSSTGTEVHLDICTIWRGESRLLAPPYGCMHLNLSDLLPVRKAGFNGSMVSVPKDPDKFLEAYYGSTWKIPDPGYSATLRTTPRKLRKELRSINLSQREAFEFRRLVEERRLAGNQVGVFNSRAIFSLYPVSEYEKYCGW